MTEWTGTERAACVDMLTNFPTLAKHADPQWLVEQMGQYETALSAALGVLRDIVDECMGDVGQVSWPPGVKLVRKARTVLTRYALPEGIK